MKSIRVLSLAIVLLLCVAGMKALAEESPVVSVTIGGKTNSYTQEEFESVVQTWKDTDDAILDLLADCEAKYIETSDEINLTLNLNGYTLTGPNDDDIFLLYNRSKLIINGPGKIRGKGINNTSTATLTINNVNIEAGSIALQNTGILTINGNTRLSATRRVFWYYGGTIDLSGVIWNSRDEWTIYAQKKISVSSGLKLPEGCGLFLDEVQVGSLERKKLGIIRSLVTAVTFTVDIEETDNGTVTADLSYAEDGEEINLTITPDKGYRVESISVTDAAGKPVTVQENTFIMPASNVTVRVTFIRCGHQGSDHASAIAGTDGMHRYTCSICNDEATEEHRAACSVEGNSILESCLLCGSETGKITLLYKDTTTYTGSDVLVELGQSGSLQNADVAVEYSTKDGSALTDGYPVNVGSYAAAVTYENVTARVEFTIEKANSVVTKTPVANRGLTYSGSAQALVIMGEIQGGTMYYSLDGMNYSTGIPTGTSAGDYTVYYKVDGDQNHLDSPAASLTVTIDKATPVYTVPSGLRAVYGQTLAEISLPTGFAWQDPPDTVVGSVGSNTYLVTFTPDDTANLVCVQDIEVEIVVDQANPGYTAPVGNSLTYTGVEQPLVSSGITADGILVYGLTEDGAFAQTVPVAVKPGSYTVYWKVLGDPNHRDTEVQSIQVSIQKACVTATVNAADKTYDGNTNAEVTVMVSDGLMQGDSMIITGLGGAFTDANAGENKTVAIDHENLSITGINADCYEVSFPDTTTATIAPKMISEAEITLAFTTTVYTGKEQKPAVTAVMVVGQIMTADQYTVTYAGNVNAGAAKVVVTFVGNYEGTMDAAFTIVKAPLTIKADVKSMVTGGSIPELTVTYTGFVNGETEAVLTRLPAVSTEADGKMQGSYPITVSGAEAENYAINYVNGVLTVSDHVHTWTFSEKEGAILATCGNVDGGCSQPEQSIILAAPTDLTYSGQAKEVTLQGTIEGVTAPNIVYTGDRINVTGEDCTASITIDGVTATLSFRIKAADIGAAVIMVDPQADLVYDGNEKKPAVTVELGGQPLLRGTDYTVHYINNVDAGEAIITVSVLGNFAGNKETTFTIAKAAPAQSHFVVTLPDDLVYDGNAKSAMVEAAASVTGMGDITVKYEPDDPTGVGTYKVLIDVSEGSNYAGVQNLEVGSFTIVRAGVTAAADKASYTYGETITVKATAADASPQKQMALFLGKRQISAPAVPDAGGLYNLTCATTDKQLPVGESIITARYVGLDDHEDTGFDLPITITPAELTISGLTTQDRPYEPGNHTITVISAELAGRIDETDDVSVDMTALQVTVDSDDAGEYAAVKLPEMIKLKGDAAPYYRVIGGGILPAQVRITPADPGKEDHPTVSVDKPYSAGMTLGELEPSIPANAFIVPGTVNWKAPADTPVIPGQTYEWVFTPAPEYQGNYKEVTGSTVIYPVTPTPSATPDVTATPSATPAVTATPSATPVVTATPSVTPAVTATPTATPVVTATPSATPVVTDTPSATPEVTATPSATPEMTATPSATPEVTATPSATPEVTATPSVTPAVTTPPKPVPPTVLYPADNQLMTAEEGQTITLRVIAADADLYQWYVDCNNGAGFCPVDGANEARLTLAVSGADNGSRYVCRITNVGGTISSPVFILDVLPVLDVPSTGDNSHIMLWAALLLMSAAGLIMVREKRTV